MNTRTTTPGAIALAAFLLTLGAACGSEITPPSQDIGGGDTTSEPAEVRRTGVPDCFNSTADAAAVSCRGNADRNRSRLDFGDDGRG